jgi:hypothetical protein
MGLVVGSISIYMGEAFFVMTQKSCCSSRISFGISDVMEGYNGLLETHLLLTASITAAWLSGLGDVIAQLQQQTSPFEDPSHSLLQAESSIQLDSSTSVTFPSFSSSNTNNHTNTRLMDTERFMWFFLKSLGGGLIWLAWYHVADDVTQRLLFVNNYAYRMTMGCKGGNNPNMLEAPAIMTLNILTYTTMV